MPAIAVSFSEGAPVSGARGSGGAKCTLPTRPDHQEPSRLCRGGEGLSRLPGEADRTAPPNGEESAQAIVFRDVPTRAHFRCGEQRCFAAEIAVGAAHSVAVYIHAVLSAQPLALARVPCAGVKCTWRSSVTKRGPKRHISTAGRHPPPRLRTAGLGAAVRRPGTLGSSPGRRRSDATPRAAAQCRLGYLDGDRLRPQARPSPLSEIRVGGLRLHRPSAGDRGT